MWSPPWFCLCLSFCLEAAGLSGNLPCDIWLPALSQKVKGEPCAPFNGNAKNQCDTKHPAAAPPPPPRLLLLQQQWVFFGGCITPTTGASGDVWAQEVKTAKPKVSYEQKGFPLDERVQTLKPETRQENSRSVWCKEGSALFFLNEAFFIYVPFKGALIQLIFFILCNLYLTR